MHHAFDQHYWDEQWSPNDASTAMSTAPPNPHLVALADLQPGTALDAGCGAGAEAIWLAQHDWRVTAADIAEEALDHGRRRAGEAGVGDAIEWVLTDLSTWTPPASYDLVTTHYAHPSIPQLDFYERVAAWVAPGGTLMVVGHAAHSHHPESASVTAEAIVRRLDGAVWQVLTAAESERSMARPGGRDATIHDVVVRAQRVD